MLDANSTVKGDLPFVSMLCACGLDDLHALNPAPSTYMGARERRIDFMFGCHHVVNATERQGTLSYYEGPQADHRGLYIDVNLAQLLDNKKQT